MIKSISFQASFEVTFRIPYSRLFMDDSARVRYPALMLITFEPGFLKLEATGINLIP
jgi:hypothetical protein